MSLLYLVKWTGPYSYEAACGQNHNGVYFVFGRLRRGRAPSAPRPLYVGKAFRTGGVGARLSEHDPREFIHKENSWWLGQIVAPEQHTDADVRVVEAMIIWGVGPERNDRGTMNPPRQSATVINHWYTRDGDRRYRHVGAMAHVPDVLSWDRSHWRVADRLQKPSWERG